MKLGTLFMELRLRTIVKEEEEEVEENVVHKTTLTKSYLNIK